MLKKSRDSTGVSSSCVICFLPLSPLLRVLEPPLLGDTRKGLSFPFSDIVKTEKLSDVRESIACTSETHLWSSCIGVFAKGIGWSS